MQGLISENATPAEAGAELLLHMATEMTRRDHKSDRPASPRYWLVKFAPFRTSWTEIVQRGTFTLRGVRSYQARQNLSRMSVGDLVLFYQSQQQQAIVGVMTVARTAYSDPTSSDPQWLTCDLKPIKTFPRKIPLSQLRENSLLSDISLVRQPRLAVAPIASQAFYEILQLASKQIDSV
jgi:predicted RNA-binding protein with PUA-like domain